MISTEKTLIAPTGMAIIKRETKEGGEMVPACTADGKVKFCSYFEK